MLAIMQSPQRYKICDRERTDSDQTVDGFSLLAALPGEISFAKK